MTSNTVSAKLDAVLDPLESITKQVHAALELARRNRLPPAFTHVIKVSAADLENIHHTLLDIALALDPDLAKDRL